MLVCGIDEAGRGPLAGPVTAAAVVLPEGFPTEELGDSKALSPARRERLVPLIRTRSRAWAVGWASHGEIDRVNILRASHIAMRRAIEELRALGEDVGLMETIVDGSVLPELGVPARALIKADATVPAVMAASILAKVARDRWMVRYAQLEPEYEFERHKGYPTPRHRELVARLGPSRIHRLSFRSG
ncbi:MAG: ribonuclease HII [Spirochaetota bacterium]